MKSIIYICSFITTILFFAHNVSARQRYPAFNYTQWQEKRSKPSLSIVNPLDVLRQRIMLEMSRRQEREKNRQIEANKVLLQQIGKRSGDYMFPFDDAVTGDIVNNFDNRRPIDTNTGQKLSADQASKKRIQAMPILVRGGGLNLGQGKDMLDNDVDDVAVNEYIPNDDYRLRYVYSMQQNRYNHV